MSERPKPHNGRDTSGHRRVKQADVEELRGDFIRDDVRLGGAVADTGPHAGERGEKISELIDDNRQDVAKVTRASRSGTDAKRKKR